MEGVGQGGEHTQGPIVWTNAMSSFVLKYLAELVASGVRIDKGFKSSHLNACSRAVMEHFQTPVTGVQINYHLKKWRNRWSKINSLKKISGSNWDDQTKSIVLDHDHYIGHISKHKKDANFLNNPLELYDEIATIFYIGMATGNYAKSSVDVLSSDAIEDIETIVRSNERGEDLSEDETTNNGRNTSTGESSRIKPPKQHKRHRVQDDLLLQTITDSLGKLADAIEKTGKNSEVPDDLWDHVSA